MKGKPLHPIEARTLALDNQSSNCGSNDGCTRPLRAISAVARHAPCHVASATDGMSYIEAPAMLCTENKPNIISRTCAEKSLGRRSASLPIPLAADHRTSVSYQDNFNSESREDGTAITLSCKEVNNACKMPSISSGTSMSSSSSFLWFPSRPSLTSRARTGVTPQTILSLRTTIYWPLIWEKLALGGINQSPTLDNSFVRYMRTRVLFVKASLVPMFSNISKSVGMAKRYSSEAPNLTKLHRTCKVPIA